MVRTVETVGCVGQGFLLQRFMWNGGVTAGLGRFSLHIGAGPGATKAARNIHVMFNRYYHSGTTSPQKIGPHCRVQVV